MNGAGARKKGQRGELEALKLLGDELGILLTRNLEQTRNGGGDCVVIKGWCLEIKRCEQLSRPAWWRQACRQAEQAGARPMLLYRRSKESWTAWIHTTGNSSREGTLIDAAGAIREGWV